MQRRIDLPELLETDAEFLRVAAFRETEGGDRLLGQRAARALAEQRVLAAQLHTALVVRAGLARPVDAHVAGRDTDDGTRLVTQQLRRRKARIDLDAERFGLAGEPAADIGERHHVVAVIRHQRRHQDIRQADAAGRPEPEETVLGDGCLDRHVVLAAPFRQQAVEPDRIDHRAGEDVRADLRTLLDDDDRDVGRNLLEPDRRGEAGRPGPDDDDVEFHGLARRKVRMIGHVRLSCSAGLFRRATGRAQRSRGAASQNGHLTR